MEMMELIIWSLMELVKYILVINGILGCSIRKDRKKYLLIIYIMLIGTSWLHLADNLFLYRATFGFIMICLVFDEKITVKIRGYLISYLAIGSIDLFLWSFLINLFPDLEWMKESDYFSNLAGLIWWLGIVILVRKQRNSIHQFFVTLSFGWTMAIGLAIFGLGLVAGGIQYGLSVDLPEQAQKKILLIYMIVMMLVTVGSVILVYNIITRKSLEKIHEIEKENLILQQKYYEGKIQQNEEMQKFRHDMKKHMKVIQLLCEKNEIKELQEYVKGYLQEYPKQEMACTGNIISDYFIGETISELQQKKDFEYSIMGNFPKELAISNVELCILMANALDNAKNAILQVEGSTFLGVQIKNFNGHIMIQIENSKTEEVKKAEEKPSPGHGYGLKNMRDVVEKHNGTMETKDEGKTFRLSIFI